MNMFYEYDLGIVVPTYNESDNIIKLLDRVVKEVTQFKIKTLVLFMDDSSPDGTKQIIEGYKLIMKKSEFVELQVISRSGKQGIATAYTQGFSLIKNKCEFLLEMDADLSHRPEHIHELFAFINSGNDLVVGSRYIHGGKIENWSLIRRIISISYSKFAGIVLNLPINDMTGGYNIFRSKIFTEIKLDKIISKGFLFQIELKAKVVRGGYKFMESPICFPDRVHGVSKFNRKVIFEAATKIWTLV
jgi:dolichol-phosphate mannosyltransferase